jgi:hypothetical protein
MDFAIASIVVGSTVAGTAIMGTTVFLNRKEYEDLQESSDSKNVSDTDAVHTKSPKNTKHGQFSHGARHSNVSE